MKLSIVVPCYNEEAVLPETCKRLVALLAELVASGRISPNSHVVFVDDGSRDATWSQIETLANVHGCIQGIKLSRNKGHQTALLAGLLTADGDALISVDADLQDDLNAIGMMVD